MPEIETKKFESATELFNELVTYQSSPIKFLFRGQRDASWGLVPGALRKAKSKEDPESRIRDEFKNFGSELRLLHNYKLAGNESAFLFGARYYNGFTIFNIY